MLFIRFLPLFTENCSLGMNTTAGSFSLLKSVVPDDAGVVKRLRAAGAIILGPQSSTLLPRHTYSRVTQERPICLNLRTFVAIWPRAGLDVADSAPTPTSHTQIRVARHRALA